MHSTLKPKQADDPHDVLVVTPDDARVVPSGDAVRVAPSDEELANLLREAARHHLDPQTHAGSDSPAGPPVDTPPVPPVDTTFRPAAVNDLLVAGPRQSIGGRAVRAFTALLLAACIAGAAIAWQSSGNVAKQIVAKWAPQFILTLLPLEKPDLSAQPTPPAVQAADANAAPSQPAPPAQTAPEAVAPAAAAPAVAPAAAPSADSAQLLQSMARDLASVGQEVEQLKASIEQLKASQQQMSRDAAKASEAKASEAKASEAKASEAKASELNKASEQNLRPKISALPPRPAAARVRKPVPPYPPAQAAAAPALPPAAPYVPRPPEPQPQAAAPPPADPELSSVPRPPMPLRQ